ncbi:MAG: hypothetical protein K2G04_07530, partial [Oscillospiraceae bacterium]|nr:hypothetical protein [Oscillospiraceae bacterium]
MKFRFGSKNSESAEKRGFGVSSLIGVAAIIFLAAGFFYLYSERQNVSADEDVKSAFVLSEVSRELTVPEIV